MSIAERIRYKWLKLELFILVNFGKCDFGGTQYFKWCFVPKVNVANRHLLQQHFQTYQSWSAGPFFILLDERE